MFGLLLSYESLKPMVLCAHSHSPKEMMRIQTAFFIVKKTKNIDTKK